MQPLKGLSKLQQRRIARRQTKPQTAVNAVVVSHHGQDLLVERLDDQQRLRARARRTLGRLTTGDWVGIEDDGHQHAVIEHLGKRSNLLTRPDAYGKNRPMAANIDQVIILLAPTPWMNPEVVERTMIAVFDLPASPIIVLNKTDTLSDLDETFTKQIENQLDEWQQLGFNVYKISAVNGSGLDALKNRLDQRRTLLVGLSGTGKTTLTRKLTPQAHSAEVRELSGFNQEGVHTTRTSTLYHIPGIDGSIIDAPGVRDFPLSHPRFQAIQKAFPEIVEHAQWCRFNDCRHVNEPQCAVLAAVESGKISKRRHALYQEIMQDYKNEY